MATAGLLDRILLRSAEAKVRAYGDERAAEVRRLHAAGDARLAGARELGGAVTRVAECVLLVGALRCYLRAREAAEPGLGAPPFDPAVQAALDGGDDHFDALDPDALAAVHAALVEATNDLRGSVEVRTLAHLRGARIGRIAAVAVLAVWALFSLLAPKNLAKGKPVAMSGRFPGTPDPSGVVDGDRGGSYGIHTLAQQGAWIRIDLEAPHAVKTIKVYNRGDGWFDECLPLAAELSDDGITWTEIGRRTEHFSQSFPWVIDAGGRSGRYVRLRIVDKQGVIALSEVEVYGQ